MRRILIGAAALMLGGAASAPALAQYGGSPDEQVDGPEESLGEADDTGASVEKAVDNAVADAEAMADEANTLDEVDPDEMIEPDPEMLDEGDDPGSDEDALDPAGPKGA